MNYVILIWKSVSSTEKQTEKEENLNHFVEENADSENNELNPNDQAFIEENQEGK